MAIATILIAAMGGVLVTTARAVEQGSDRNARASEASSAAAMIVEDLRSATEINDVSATSVELRVPDRTGDGEEEEIAYRWDPRAGSLLIRDVGGENASIVTGVKAFEISVDQRPQPSTTASSVGTLENALAVPVGASYGTFSVGSQGALGLFVLPTLPPNTRRYSVNQIRVPVGKEGSTDGILLISAYQAGPGGVPTDRLLAYTSVLESALPNSPTMTTFTLTQVEPAYAGLGVVVVFSSVSGLVMNDALPGFTVGAGGGLLKGTLDALGGTLDATGSVLGGVLGGVSLVTRDAARLELIKSSVIAPNRRVIKSQNAIDWSAGLSTERMRFELRGITFTVSYTP